MLAELLAGTWRRFGILAVEEQVALLSGGFSVIALDGSEAVGFLGLSPRASAGEFGECWTDITLVAVASDYSAPAILRRLLSVVVHRLGDRPSTSLVCLTAQDWLVRALADVDFRETDRVLSYVRSQRAPLPTAPHAADLRLVASSEAATILGLNAAAFEPLWRYDERTVLGWLLTSDHAVLAHRNGTPQGFAITTLHASDGYAQLIRVATHPAARGQAIGRQLVVDAIAYAWEVGAVGVSLNTQASNVVAQNLYEDLGFRPTGGALSVMIRRL
jgi:ribosomal-protein-alanine N-acetyltransferase